MRGTAKFSVGDRVIVNDVDITDSVAAMRYTEAVGETPTLELSLRCEPNVIEGEGVVIASGGLHETASAAVIEWLDTIDPDYVEQRVLNLGFGVPVGEGVLMVLREVAGGAQLRETT